MTYCNRTKLKLKVDCLLPACRFGYCVCYLDAKIEYCYECDDFAYATTPYSARDDLSYEGE